MKQRAATLTVRMKVRTNCPPWLITRSVAAGMFGSLAGTSCFAAMRAIRTIMQHCWAQIGQTSLSPIPRTMCRSTATFPDWARCRHREFSFASGEMSESQFTTFLTDALTATSGVMRDGAIAFVCMDWRHMGELLAVGRAAFTELKNLVVWNKTNGGMGAFYRSKHELIFVFKAGVAEHTNSFGLGDTGRYRTNVWDYAGISSISATRDAELAMHPTVKPVALVADAIRDCSSAARSSSTRSAAPGPL